MSNLKNEIFNLNCIMNQSTMSSPLSKSWANCLDDDDDIITEYNWNKHESVRPVQVKLNVVPIEYTKEELSNMESVTKTDDGEYSLFNYKKCDEKDTNTFKQLRGVTFKGDKLVSRGFPYTPECVVDTTEYKMDEGVYVQAHEGATVRVWYDEKWHVSTNRKMDADNSKWSSDISFGQLFEDAINRLYHNTKHFADHINSLKDFDGVSIFDYFLCSLNENNQYIFLVCNNEDTRIVCSASDKLCHVGTYTPDNHLLLNDNVGVPHPAMLHFSTYEELKEHVMDTNYTVSPGVIRYGNDGSQVKFINSKYKELFDLRGNNPSVKYRYLQLRSDIEKLNTYKTLYSKYQREFDHYEKVIQCLATDIHIFYVNRYIKKQYIMVPQELFRIMRVCHEWHTLDRRTNIVLRDVVYKTIGEQNPTHINRMIKLWERHNTLLPPTMPLRRN